jgi:hypothetical protein
MCAASAYEASAHPILSSSEIKTLLASPNRTPANIIFSSKHWVKEGDQGHAGSCNGWAGAMALSKTRYKRGITDGLVLSGSYVYSRINNNQDHGSALDRGMAELMAYGAPPASICPKETIWRKDTVRFDAEAAKHRGLSCYAAQTKEGFISGIALGFIGIVAVQVTNSFMAYRGGGLLQPASGIGNHAIHCDSVSYDSRGNLVFDVVNNWGLSWGDFGRGYCTWDMFAQPFATHTFYLVASTEDQDE